MRTVFLSLIACALIAGCAIGIQDDGSSPSVSYTVPRSYQIVYLRAQNQASQCLRGESQFKVVSRVDPSSQSGLVSVADPFTGTEVARTELQSVDAKHTKVRHTVWGRSPWDADALEAMQESVRMDTSICVVYR